jgi:hypothetical protein
MFNDTLPAPPSLFAFVHRHHRHGRFGRNTLNFAPQITVDHRIADYNHLHLPELLEYLIDF